MLTDVYADDAVLKQSQKEMEMTDLLATVTGQPASSFLARWSEPSLSVHSVEVSGPGSKTYSLRFLINPFDTIYSFV